MNKKTKTIIWIIAGVVLIGLLGVFISNWLNAAVEVPFTTLQKYLEEGLDGRKITQLYLDGYNWTAYIQDDSGRILAKFTAIGPELYSTEGLEYIKYLQGKGIVDIAAYRLYVRIYE